eukprot:183007-Pelagomonas_calceolata.AAC.2
MHDSKSVPHAHGYGLQEGTDWTCNPVATLVPDRACVHGPLLLSVCPITLLQLTFIALSMQMDESR